MKKSAVLAAMVAVVVFAGCGGDVPAEGAFASAAGSGNVTYGYISDGASSDGVSTDGAAAPDAGGSVDSNPGSVDAGKADADDGDGDSGSPGTIDIIGSVDAGSLDAGPADAGSVDAGPADAGTVDAGPADAGSVDAGPVDAGPVDAGTVDAGPADAGSVDAGPVDAGSVDAGPADAGSVDAGPVDSGSVDAGPVDSGSVDAGPVDSGTVDAGLPVDVGPSSDGNGDGDADDGSADTGPVDAGPPPCVPVSEVCYDGKDNDCDGKVDGKDIDGTLGGKKSNCIGEPVQLLDFYAKEGGTVRILFPDGQVYDSVVSKNTTKKWDFLKGDLPALLVFVGSGQITVSSVASIDFEWWKQGYKPVPKPLAQPKPGVKTDYVEYVASATSYVTVKVTGYSP